MGVATRMFAIQPTGDTGTIKGRSRPWRMGQRIVTVVKLPPEIYCGTKKDL
jgi:hypothetical protein